MESSRNILPLGYEPDKKVDASTIRGKVVCGYQGWFGCEGDGCGCRGWMHWSGKCPEPMPDGKCNVSFEIYPDTEDYPVSVLTATKYGNLGNGKKAALFSAYKKETVDIHFRWMQEYGVDGVALQRFAGEALGGRSEHFNTVAGHVREAAEKYGRVFYLCYDLSGIHGEGWQERLEKDFSEVIEGRLGLTSSPQYLHEDGKPVIELWGIGVRGNFVASLEEAVDFIQWFKSRGFYVIAGTPSWWRTDDRDGVPGFTKAYDLVDMISPWTVGRFHDDEGARKHYMETIKEDIALTSSRGQGFMPVFYSGFAWSKWNGGPRNSVPRRMGRFLWQQMKLAAEVQATCAYVAMFDEYDESTAIMKAADSSYAVPQGEYFLTTSADGEYISGEYYLREVGMFTTKWRGGESIEGELELPHTLGPVWLRTGFEEGMDARPKLQQFMAVSKGFSRAAVSLKAAEDAPLRPTVLHFEGEAGRDASFEQKLFVLNTPVSENTVLRFVRKGEGAVLDLIFTDGTKLSDAASFAVTGRSGGWQELRCSAAACKGKTAAALALVSAPANGGSIDVSFDDVIVSDAEIAAPVLR